ncbi:PfkB family carbohydrate kinase [Nocardioides sp. R-C-SC26]|uniref:PfkB family carbohydrate kinase n=1 Tax=Nocardioides sp. R-C-SC26 TaxID=2870414 RepID=UPI001E503938|nr:PfkB family carbohydrate kinase [Nocardioides sp. R-C-SC26]
MAHVVVVGGINVDVCARPSAPSVPATSNPGGVTMTPGGVGRNIAENLARLGTATHLVGAVGADRFAEIALAATGQAGVDLSHVRTVEAPTGTYVALLDHDGELAGGVSDMRAHLTTDDVAAAADLIATASWVVLDGNLAPEVMAAAWDAAGDVPVAIDPVSVPKTAVLASLAPGRRLGLLSAGTAELAAVGLIGEVGADMVWERRGTGGSRLIRGSSVHESPAIAPPPPGVVDVTGAGDAMLAAFCHASLAGADVEEAVRFAHGAAALTVACPQAVRPDLSVELVRSML